MVKLARRSRYGKTGSQLWVISPVYGKADLRFSPPREGVTMRLGEAWAQARSAMSASAREAGSALTRLFGHLGAEARQTIDAEQWRSARTWADRARAISWSRAAGIGGAVATVGVGVFLLTQPHGLRSHPPRLPTEQEWRASQAAARAMEADLSPALAAANQSVPSRRERP